MPDALSADLLKAAVIRAMDAGMTPDQAQPAEPKKPDHGFVHKVGLPVLIGGQMADLGSTLYALQHGAHEANPVVGGSPARIALTKAATTAGLAWLMEKLADKNPKGALIGSLIAGGIGAGAAAHNLKAAK